MEYLYIERVAYRYGGDAAALSGDLLLGIAVDVLLTRLPVMGFSTVTLDCRQPSLRFVGMVSFTPLDPRIQLAFIDSLPKLCRMCIFCGGINLYFAGLFCSRSICLMLLSGVGSSSGIVPPRSLIVCRTFAPTA